MGETVTRFILLGLPLMVSWFVSGSNSTLYSMSPPTYLVGMTLGPRRIGRGRDRRKFRKYSDCLMNRPPPIGPTIHAFAAYCSCFAVLKTNSITWSKISSRVPSSYGTVGIRDHPKILQNSTDSRCQWALPDSRKYQGNVSTLSDPPCALVWPCFASAEYRSMYLVGIGL